MYCGHLGIAMAANSTRRDTPVAVFVAASMAIEPFRHWLWIGIAVPITVTATAYLWRRDAQLAALLGTVAISHYAVDLLTSTLEIHAGGREIGLGWYRYSLIDFALETALICAGWWASASPRTKPGWAREPWQIPLVATLLMAQAIFSFAVAPNVV